MAIIYFYLAPSTRNSATRDRIQLLEYCLESLGKERIGLVIGDREFVGHAWFKYLKDHEINFIMRLPKHHTLTDASGRIYTAAELAVATIHPRVLVQYQVDGVWGNVWLKKLDNGDYLFLFGTVNAEFSHA